MRGAAAAQLTRRERALYLRSATGGDHGNGAVRHDDDARDARLDLPPHRDEAQVALDVQRAFVMYALNADERESRRRVLSRVICGTLRKYPELNYYQGFHDLVSVLLLTYDPDGVIPDDDTCDRSPQYAALQATVDRLSLHFVRDSMCTDLLPAMGQLKVVRNIVRAAEPEYAGALEDAFAPNSLVVALPWILTLFTHSVPDPAESARILDFVFAHGPQSVLYLSAAILLWHKERVGDAQLGEMAHLHQTLAELPLVATGTAAIGVRGGGTNDGAASERIDTGSADPSERNAADALQGTLSAGEDRHSTRERARDAADGPGSEGAAGVVTAEISAEQRIGQARGTGASATSSGTHAAAMDSDASEASARSREDRSVLPMLLDQALYLMQTFPLKSGAVHAHTVLTGNSVAFAWPQAAPSDWATLDADAERILTLPTTSVVLDALPTPPPEQPLIQRPRKRSSLSLARSRGALRILLRIVPIPISLLLGSSLLSVLFAMYLADRSGTTLSGLWR